MMPRAVTLLLVGLPVLFACGGHDDTPQGKDQAQLEVMQRRLDALDQRLATTEKDLAAGARLRERHARARAAGRRRRGEGHAGARGGEAASAGSGGGPGRALGSPRRGPRPIRWSVARELAELMTEYRRRLNALGQGVRQASPADRMAARRSLREWYIARRARDPRRPSHDRLAARTH